MGSRRGNGEGSIVKRKDGRFMGAITVGIDPHTGNPKRKYIYGNKRKEVARKMTDLKKKLFDGTYSEPSSMILSEWLKQWLKGRKNSISTNTYKFYKKFIDNHISPEIGSMKLKDIKSYHIQNLLNAKFENGRLDGKGGLSEKTVKHIYVTIHSAFKKAVDDDLIIKNVSESVDLPKDEESFEDEELQTWNNKQVNKFLNTAKDYNYYILYYLALNTGMRQGELLGVKWEDIDFKNKLLKVKRQYGRSMKFKKLKTKAGRRAIPLSEQTIKELNKHKIKQGEKKLALGKAFKDHDLICCDKIGKPITHSKLYKEFKAIIKKTDLTEITFHDTRHTFATLFLENGGNIKTLQHILGHSSITTTIDIYGHVNEEMLNNAAGTIEMMYETVKENKQDNRKDNKNKVVNIKN